MANGSLEIYVKISSAADDGAQGGRFVFTNQNIALLLLKVGYLKEKRKIKRKIIQEILKFKQKSSFLTDVTLP